MLKSRDASAKTVLHFGVGGSDVLVVGSGSSLDVGLGM